MCRDLILPMVKLDEVETYKISSVRDTLYSTWYEGIGAPNPMDQVTYNGKIDDMFNQLVEYSDNEGATDEHRALNYLIIRAATVYSEGAKVLNRGFKFDSVTVKPVLNVGMRKIVEVIFYFRQDLLLEAYSIKVDVTGEFPYLASIWSRYFSGS